MNSETRSSKVFWKRIFFNSLILAGEPEEEILGILGRGGGVTEWQDREGLPCSESLAFVYLSESHSH